MATPLPPPLSELEARLGYEENTLEGAEKARAERALADAATLILAEVRPALAEAWRSAAPDVVALVALTAARRGYENPRGIQSETFGAHAVGLSESTGVYLTSRELAQVIRAATGRAAGQWVGSVRTPSAYGDGLDAITYSVPATVGGPVPWITEGAL